MARDILWLKVIYFFFAKITIYTNRKNRSWNTHTQKPLKTTTSSSSSLVSQLSLHGFHRTAKNSLELTLLKATLPGRIAQGNLGEYMWGLSSNSRGLYTHDEGFPIEGGMTLAHMRISHIPSRCIFPGLCSFGSVGRIASDLYGVASTKTKIAYFMEIPWKIDRSIDSGFSSKLVQITGE